MSQNEVRRVGLARALSKLGYCSRSRAVELIRAGHVAVDGRIRHDPESPIFISQNQIAIDGALVQEPKRIYLMMNKPRGMVTTASDEKGRDTVYTILKRRTLSTNSNGHQPWLAPVGRLDKASEGLLLLTNDSEWAARITAPETHLPKTYHVHLNTIADARLVKALCRGVRARDGELLKVMSARDLRAGQKTSWIEIMLQEGRNRHIRRMIEALGLEVLRLVRVAIGPLKLGDLAKGEHRALTGNEKRMLDRATRVIP